MSVRVLSQLEESWPSHAGVYQPILIRYEYQVLEVSDDGCLSVLTENGDMKDDLSLPTSDHLTFAADAIRDYYNDGKDFRVVVLRAMGQELVMEAKLQE